MPIWSQVLYYFVESSHNSIIQLNYNVCVKFPDVSVTQCTLLYQGLCFFQCGNIKVLKICHFTYISQFMNCTHCFILKNCSFKPLTMTYYSTNQDLKLGNKLWLSAMNDVGRNLQAARETLGPRPRTTSAFPTPSLIPVGIQT